MKRYFMSSRLYNLPIARKDCPCVCIIKRSLTYAMLSVEEREVEEHKDVTEANSDHFKDETRMLTCLSSYEQHRVAEQ